MPAVVNTSMLYVVIDKGAHIRFRACYRPAAFLYVLAQATEMNDHDKRFQNVGKGFLVTQFSKPLYHDGLRFCFIHRHVLNVSNK